MYDGADGDYDDDDDDEDDDDDDDDDGDDDVDDDDGDVVDHDDDGFDDDDDGDGDDDDDDVHDCAADETKVSFLNPFNSPYKILEKWRQLRASQMPGTMFLIRLNHLIAVLVVFETTALTKQNVKHPFMAASWGYKHFVIL